MGVTAKKFLEVAAAEIGYKERYDVKTDNWTNDNKYGIWYGNNKVAWCGQFVSWVAFMCGVLGTLIPKYQSTFAGLSWFRKNDQTGYWPPQPGDIFFMSEYHPDKAGAWNDTTGTGWITVHTGIVEKYLGDGYFQTIEGNTNTGGSAQGNGVYRLKRHDTPDGHRFIFGRPKWDPEPIVVTPPPAPPKPPVVVKPPSRTETRPPLPPIKGATYTGPKTVDLSVLQYAAKHPGYRCNAAFRWNGIVWAWLAKNSPAYCRANQALWLKESAYTFGLQGQRATQEMYRVLNSRAPKLYQKVSLPTWPGALGVKAAGGIPTP